MADETEETKYVFTDEGLVRYAKVIAGAINWNNVFGTVKVFFIINFDLGAWIEKKDYTWAKKLLTLVNTWYVNGKISDEWANAIKEVFAAIEDEDETTFMSVLSVFVASKINVLESNTQEEALISSILTLIANLDTDFCSDIKNEFDALVLADEAQDGEEEESTEEV